MTSTYERHDVAWFINSRLSYLALAGKGANGIAPRHPECDQKNYYAKMFSFFWRKCVGVRKLKKRAHIVVMLSTSMSFFPFFCAFASHHVTFLKKRWWSSRKRWEMRKRERREFHCFSAGNFLVSLLILSFNFTGEEDKNKLNAMKFLIQILDKFCDLKLKAQTKALIIQSFRSQKFCTVFQFACFVMHRWLNGIQSNKR